ncbi:glutathione S-transferase family protein [Pseudohoeflea coraliihabitans]|uniref:Glutathione S-transferase family protein n=1 Tax=Pseudohoeflea coraliihabitans TaxID=2860393 RepID=A0ABS6WQM1_9HYPH|nr:glutathione S-transferase family protein [Pseudohoeflea sp. DP4N28-3]MBW3098272.1 glutathione S-transferase family protein [Pseudohoeflea sp. DP4N28-3]
MYKLLGRQTSGNVQKVLFMLEQTGASYSREDYGRQFENTATAEYKAMNPTSKVPTLVDGEKVIWESNTILRYLADKDGPQLTGASAAEKTEVERWMDFQLAAINPGYMAAFKGGKLAPEERAPEYEGMVKDLVNQLKIVDGHLKGRDFLALGKLTIADICLAPIVKRCLRFKIDRPELVELERWMNAIDSEAAFQRALSPDAGKAA